MSSTPAVSLRVQSLGWATGPRIFVLHRVSISLPLAWGSYPDRSLQLHPKYLHQMDSSTTVNLFIFHFTIKVERHTCKKNKIFNSGRQRSRRSGKGKSFCNKYYKSTSASSSSVISNVSDILVMQILYKEELHLRIIASPRASHWFTLN